MTVSISDGFSYTPESAELFPTIHSERKSVHNNASLSSGANVAITLGKAGLYQLLVLGGETTTGIPDTVNVKVGAVASSTPHYVFPIPRPGVLVVNILVKDKGASFNVHNPTAKDFGKVLLQRLGA